MICIRRYFSICFLLLLLVVLRLPVQVSAAGMDSSAGAVTTSGGRLNVRSGPSSGSAVVASLGKGSYVTLLSKSGAWWRIEYDKGKYGYCHADYITPVSGTPVEVATQSGSLNVRSGGGTSYPKIASLARGEVVISLSSSGSWTRVLYHGTKTGYVSSQYLKTGYPLVKLYVPNLKQMDSRWGEKILGESGKTFAQIGCATTAIAMVESHRTGITVYPDAMSERLRYTPSGSVYWPAHFTTVTDGRDYLSRVYSLLRQGKPVLFGATNAYGKQHWIVITGYSGGNHLIPAGFSIQDPGSSTRINLQQFLDQYPNFYKYFYY